MIDNKKILAIIPARSGSKRLPQKNILPLNEKPLIQWTIDSAQKSKYIDTVMVSTDCTKIAQIAENSGIKVPYLRSEQLSNDTATSMDVVFDVLKYYETQNSKYDLVMLLQPTSPLRTTQDIDNAIESLINKKASSIVSVTECEHSPLWSNTLPEDLKLLNFIDQEIISKRSQDLPTHYRLNGAIYLFNIKALKENSNYLSQANAFAFIMKKQHSIDIDDKLDFDIAEIIMKSLKSHQK